MELFKINLMGSGGLKFPPKLPIGQTGSRRPGHAPELPGAERTGQIQQPAHMVVLGMGEGRRIQPSYPLRQQIGLYKAAAGVESAGSSAGVNQKVTIAGQPKVYRGSLPHIQHR